MTLTAAVDGSSVGNPGPGGWAWYVNESCWDAGGWAEATNNRGELTAVLELLRASAHCSDDLMILCDSRYVIDSLTKWRFGWKKRGWRKADKTPVKNADLMQALDRELEGRAVNFTWVRGHTGHPLNEAADTLAHSQALAYQRGETPSRGPGFHTYETDAHSKTTHGAKNLETLW